MVDRLARRASEELHEAQEAAEYTVGMPGRGRRGVVGLVALGVVAIAVIVGVQLLVGGEPEEQGFVGPPSEPSRRAELVLYFRHDFDPALGEIIALDAASWDGVEFAAFWEADRVMSEFLARFADDPALIERAEQNPAVFPSSVRLWVGQDGDVWALLGRARAEVPAASHVELGSDGLPYEYAVVVAGVVRLGPTGTPPPSDNPWGFTFDEASEYQADILGDGKLTFEEYTAAVGELVDCVRAGGVTISDPIYSTEYKQYEYEMTAPTRDRADADYEVFGACHREYLDVIESAWVIQNAPTPAEAQAIRDEIGTCLRNKGFEISDHPTHGEIIQVIDQAERTSADAVSTALSCMRSY